jgi:hypothetical protein
MATPQRGDMSERKVQKREEQAAAFPIFAL